MTYGEFLEQTKDTSYFMLPSGPWPCGWKYCGTYGCIVEWDSGTPCKEARHEEGQ